MTNAEVINHINAINEFAKREQESGKESLTKSGIFKLRRTLNMLMEVYKTYDEVRKDIEDKNQIDPEKRNEEFMNLLNADTEVYMILLLEDDFKEDCNFSDVMLLDFMIEN